MRKSERFKQELELIERINNEIKNHDITHKTATGKVVEIRKAPFEDLWVVVNEDGNWLAFEYLDDLAEFVCAM